MQMPSKQALRELFGWNRDKFAKMMKLAGIYDEKPHLKTKHDLTKEDFNWCKKRLERMCFVVIKK